MRARISDWMVTMIDEALRERERERERERSYGEPSAIELTMKRVHFVKKWV